MNYSQISFHDYNHKSSGVPIIIIIIIKSLNLIYRIVFISKLIKFNSFIKNIDIIHPAERGITVIMGPIFFCGSSKIHENVLRQLEYA